MLPEIKPGNAGNILGLFSADNYPDHRGWMGGGGGGGGAGAGRKRRKRQ